MRVTILAIICMTISTIVTAQNPGVLTDLLEANVEGPVVVMDLVKFKPGGEKRNTPYTTASAKRYSRASAARSSSEAARERSERSI